MLRLPKYNKKYITQFNKLIYYMIERLPFSGQIRKSIQKHVQNQ